eukprot:SAG31_NODE_1320_length_8809_cov_4.243398_1_plen_161_part_00
MGGIGDGPENLFAPRMRRYEGRDVADVAIDHSPRRLPGGVRSGGSMARQLSSSWHRPLPASAPHRSPDRRHHPPCADELGLAPSAHHRLRTTAIGRCRAKSGGIEPSAQPLGRGSVKPGARQLHQLLLHSRVQPLALVGVEQCGVLARSHSATRTQDRDG